MNARYLPNVLATPTQLINTKGQAQFGLFENSVHNLNFADYSYRTVMDTLAGKLSRHFAAKQFQFVSVCGPDWLLAVAIADIRYASSGFAYFFKQGQPTIETGILLPLQMGCHMSESPVNGMASLRRGKISWHITPRADTWQLTVNTAEIQAELSLHKAEQLPLALCGPTAYQGVTYTEKNNALAVTGYLTVAKQTIDLTQALGNYDFSAGFMRRETSWRWASLNTWLDGKKLGFNLAAGVNETGLTENALWFQEQRQHLSSAQFQFDRLDCNSMWQINTLCGEVDLQFTPQFCRQERVQALILASNFRQYVGHFSGELTLLDGRRLTLNHHLGLVEDHYAKW
jgi:hypothetical protein